MSETITIDGKKYRVVGGAKAGPRPNRGPEKRPKYGNHKVTVGYIQFDSKREAARWEKLCGWEQGGIICDLVRQPKFVLAPSVQIAGETRKRPAVRYSADFAYTDASTGERIVEDVKSAPTAKSKEFRRIQHMMKSVHGIDVKVVK